jgi:hypothetical protein
VRANQGRRECSRGRPEDAFRFHSANVSRAVVSNHVTEQVTLLEDCQTASDTARGLWIFELGSEQMRCEIRREGRCRLK